VLKDFKATIKQHSYYKFDIIPIRVSCYPNRATQNSIKMYKKYENG